MYLITPKGKSPHEAGGNNDSKAPFLCDTPTWDGTLSLPGGREATQGVTELLVSVANRIGESIMLQLRWVRGSRLHLCWLWLMQTINMGTRCKPIFSLLLPDLFF